jgi:tetratricopeptide (TPR) repeat protein
MSTHPLANLKDVLPHTPLEYEEFDGTLALICRACRKTGHYSVGRIFIEPATWQRAMRQEAPFEEAVYFSGYFRCKKCGSGGPWDLSRITRTRLTALLILAAASKPPGPIHFGELRLFDGTRCHSAAEGESHLLSLIDAAPDNYFLWSRLGNLFNVAEDPQRALPAFEKAVELNPQDVESHHSLAEIYFEGNDWQTAAEHYHDVLRYARHAPPRTREKDALLRQIVRQTLERLLELHHKTKGRIDLLPAPTPEAIAVSKDDVPVVVLTSFDLAREDDWDRLVGTFLGDAPAKPRRAPSPPVIAAPSYERAPSSRVGRNDPCPCGSGKKFKKCCWR